MLGVARLITTEHPGRPGESLGRTGSEILAKTTSFVRTFADDPEIRRFVFLGSGALYGLASEAMLKMKEMALAESQAFHFLEFRHGPISA